MPLRPLLLVPCLIVCGCASMTPSPAPSEIPLPPVALLAKCPEPQALPDVAAVNDLVDTLMQALRWGSCERDRSIGFMQSWPR